MKKVNSIYNQLNNKKKAFTLIELLIVIAIIGILFIVLVSKVDFATDKAKATGVQTDFRAFQVALDTVAKENAGFNTFGFNAGDNAGAIPAGYAFVDENAKNATIGDGIRNSYDQGDKNLNGKQDTGEVFTGRKIYTEKWTEVYTLVKPGTTGLDANAVFALESAINANLDPKLHITINAAYGKIAMANQARDPWKNEYHGVYISQAERDNGADRGAIIIYSNGANGKWGSAHDITNGIVSVTVPGNNKDGKDDYSFVSCYTFVNGYGEVLNATTGFSNNQSFNGAGTNNTPSVVPGGNGGNNAGGNAGSQTPSELTSVALGGTYTFKSNYDVNSVFTVALSSTSISLDADTMMADCPLLIGSDFSLSISGYSPDDVPNTYMIMYTSNLDTYAYVSEGMLSQFEGIVDESVFAGEGWYHVDAVGYIQKTNTVPSITISNNCNVYVSNLNDLLPLFGSSNENNVGYAMLEGNGSVFYDGVSTKGLTFRSEADCSKFKELKINGRVIPTNYYTVTSGSTVITLNKSLCELLPDDTYTIEIVSTDGYAQGSFEVDRSTKIANNTGVKTNISVHVSGSITFSVNSTNAATLYDLLVERKQATTDANGYSSIFSVGEWSVDDADNSYTYVDEYGIIRNIKDVVLESNKTYNFTYLLFDSWHWERVINLSSESAYAQLFKFGTYNIITVDVEGREYKMACHKASTYKQVAHSLYPIWYWLADVSIYAQKNGFNCYREDYLNKVVIYWPGTEGFGTQEGYFAEALLDSYGDIIDFDEKVEHGDVVALYAASVGTDECASREEFKSMIDQILATVN